jgi:hypothetical protein
MALSSRTGERVFSLGVSFFEIFLLSARRGAGHSAKEGRFEDADI